MSKLLLWISITLFGGIASLIPVLWGSTSLFWPIILSMAGGLIGVWVWYRFLRFY